MFLEVGIELLLLLDLAVLGEDAYLQLLHGRQSFEFVPVGSLRLHETFQGLSLRPFSDEEA